MDNGTWPSRISVAVFLFETKDGGKQWFEKFHTQCKGSNIEIMDSVLGDTREEYRTGKSYWSLLSFCAFFFLFKDSNQVSHLCRFSAHVINIFYGTNIH